MVISLLVSYLNCFSVRNCIVPEPRHPSARKYLNKIYINVSNVSSIERLLHLCTGRTCIVCTSPQWFYLYCFCHLLVSLVASFIEPSTRNASHTNCILLTISKLNAPKLHHPLSALPLNNTANFHLRIIGLLMCEVRTINSCRNTEPTYLERTKCRCVVCALIYMKILESISSNLHEYYIIRFVLSGSSIRCEQTVLTTHCNRCCRPGRRCSSQHSQWLDLCKLPSHGQITVLNIFI